MTTVYQNAAAFVSRGVGVCPIPYRRKIPMQPWQIYETHLPTDKELRQWFPSELRNYGVVLGWQRLAVLDFDEMDAFYQWQMWTIDNCRLLDNALRVKTGRGVHIYMHLLEELSNTKMPGIDFKVHGFVIGPGSTHPSGAKYTQMTPFEIPIIEKLADVLPAETLELSTLYSEEEPIPVNWVNTPGGVVPASLGALSSDPWEQAEQGAMFDQLSPVERIKSRWRLEAFFPGEKQDRGGYLHVCCPFHQDQQPSAWVNVQRQLFGCHSCNFKPMSVIGFYAALHQVEIKAAIAEMLKSS